MYEYNMFVNKYYMYFRTDLTFTDYIQLQEKINSCIDILITYESIPMPDNKVFEYVMYTMLKKYPTNQVLSGRHDLEIKNMIKHYAIKTNKEQKADIRNNPSKQYIFKQLKEIEPVFQRGTDLRHVTDRMYSDLKHLGYKDEDILNQDCDYTMLELLRRDGLGVSFTEDFEKYKKKIEFRVSNLFTKRKLDILRQEGLNVGNDMAFQFYNSSYHQMNTALKAALSFYLSGYELKEAKSDTLDDYIDTFITSNRIQINSTVDLRVSRYEQTQVRTQEEQAYIEDEKKKRQQFIAAVAALLVIVNVGKALIWELTEPKDTKEKSSFQEGKESIMDQIGDMFIDYGDGFSLGGK